MPKLSLPFHNNQSSSTRYGDDISPSNAALEPRGGAVKNHFVAASGEYVGDGDGDGPSNAAVEPRGGAVKNHFVAASGEFVGTFLFLYLAFATHLMAVEQTDAVAMANGRKSAQTVVYISLGYGFSLLVTVWAFYRISGGLFNPAVTLGLCLAGKLPWTRGIIFLPTQLLAGVVAAGLVSCMFPGDIRAVNTTLSPTTSITQGVFIEMFLTCELVFTVLMLAVEKSKDTFLAPVGVGLALFVTQLAGVYYTGGSVNPTRSFGPSVAGTWFPGYHWIYWVGPFLGAAVSAGYYRFIKYFNYEEANPGQDSATNNLTINARGEAAVV